MARYSWRVWETFSTDLESGQDGGTQHNGNPPSRGHLSLSRLGVMARGGLSIPLAGFTGMLAIASDLAPAARLTGSHGGGPPFGGSDGIGVPQFGTIALSGFKGVEHSELRLSASWTSLVTQSIARLAPNTAGSAGI